MVFTILDFLVDHVYVSTLEWQITRHENVKDAAERPNITLTIIVAHDNLWGHVIRCTRNMLHLFIWILLLGKSKVN